MVVFIYPIMPAKCSRTRSTPMEMKKSPSPTGEPHENHEPQLRQFLAQISS